MCKNINWIKVNTHSPFQLVNPHCCVINQYLLSTYCVPSHEVLAIYKTKIQDEPIMK